MTILPGNHRTALVVLHYLRTPIQSRRKWAGRWWAIFQVYDSGAGLQQEIPLMPIYVVTYEHPNEDGWKEHLMPHVTWLQARLKDGVLLASGPFSDRTVRPAMLIMSAADRLSLDQLIATDPFAEHGLIANMTVNEWDPIFGAFNNRSSMPGKMQVS